ncbi:MAG: cupin domain-containing protein [Proteobacteria bacterium]|nr:cupin domain-containing protein [Pseudomonadota bacterium]
MNNIFENIPVDLHSEVFDSLVEANGVRIERIISRGHTSPESGWYEQPRDEWVMVLRGKAIIVFDDKSPVTLREGDYINIRAHEKHRVQWTDPDQDTLWLAVHYES